MFPETDGTVSICASNGVLQAELIVTLSVEEGGTASKHNNCHRLLDIRCFLP